MTNRQSSRANNVITCMDRHFLPCVPSSEVSVHSTQSGEYCTRDHSAHDMHAGNTQLHTQAMY